MDIPSDCIQIISFVGTIANIHNMQNNRMFRVRASFRFRFRVRVRVKSI